MFRKFEEDTTYLQELVVSSIYHQYTVDGKHLVWFDMTNIGRLTGDSILANGKHLYLVLAGYIGDFLNEQMHIFIQFLINEFSSLKFVKSIPLHELIRLRAESFRYLEKNDTYTDGFLKETPKMYKDIFDRVRQEFYTTLYTEIPELDSLLLEYYTAHGEPEEFVKRHDSLFLVEKDILDCVINGNEDESPNKFYSLCEYEISMNLTGLTKLVSAIEKCKYKGLISSRAYCRQLIEEMKTAFVPEFKMSLVNNVVTAVPAYIACYYPLYKEMHGVYLPYLDRETSTATRLGHLFIPQKCNRFILDVLTDMLEVLINRNNLVHLDIQFDSVRKKAAELVGDQYPFYLRYRA